MSCAIVRTAGSPGAADHAGWSEAAAITAIDASPLL